MLGYFFDILFNNMFVTLIYCIAGVLVRGITKSKLAPWAPWGIFALHAINTLCYVIQAGAYLGWRGALALTLPHGCIEVPALMLGCWVGSELVQGRHRFSAALLALMLLTAGAAVETWVTPFPLTVWVK